MKNRRQGSDPQCLLCCISATKENGHSKHNTIVVYKVEKSDSVGGMRQLKRLLRHVKGTEDMSTVFEMRDSNDRRRTVDQTIGSLHRL